jgi:hypothetical protein
VLVEKGFVVTRTSAARFDFLRMVRHGAGAVVSSDVVGFALGVYERPPGPTRPGGRFRCSWRDGCTRASHGPGHSFALSAFSLEPVV